MTAARQLITIYCDEPSHAEPVGPFIQGRGGGDGSLAAAGQVQIDLERAGAEIVASMERHEASRRWAPHMRNVTGLARRGGGRQQVTVDGSIGGRYKWPCRRCGLCCVAKEPGLSDTLTRLANAGIAAVSLRTLIEARS
jgi:hypothetical protein